jgi:hypothetical protein
VIPGWDDPPQMHGWEMYNNFDFEGDNKTVHYVVGGSDFTDRKFNNEGGAQTDINVVVNTRNASFVAREGMPLVSWATISSDDLSGPPSSCDFIALDIEATYKLLKDRFKIVSPGNEVRLAKEWTLKSFHSMYNYIDRMSGDLLPLYMYLVMNAVCVDSSYNWLSSLWEDEQVLTAELVDNIAAQCAELVTMITGGINEWS